MKIERALFLFLFVLTILRWTLLATTDLEFDEAHYWMWSDRLAPAYFSKGPGVAFAIRGSTALFGETEFGVRFLSPLLAAGTSLLLFYLARRFFDASVGLWTVIGLNATPIFNVGAFLMTIDPLSLFFWVAAMVTFYAAIERSPRFSWWWPATGLLVGLGFLSKYTNALELLSIIAVLLLLPRLRIEFRRAGFYSLLAMFFLCAWPPLQWNQAHAWATVSHLGARGGMNEGFGLHPLELLTFLGQHFLVYSPLFFAGIAIAVIVLWRRSLHQPRRLFLVWFGVPVFAFYFLLSFHKAAAPNWDALAFPAFGLLAVAFWRERVTHSKGWQFLAGIAFALAVLMTIPALNTYILRSVGLPLKRRDPADRMRGWKSATLAVEDLRREWENKVGEKLFLIADERDRASEIAFYLRDKTPAQPGHPPCYLVESQDIANQFSFWPRYDEFVERPKHTGAVPDQAYTEEAGVNLFTGRSALFIQNGERLRAPHNITAAFSTVDRVADIEVQRFGQPMRHWAVFLCRNYRTLPL